MFNHGLICTDFTDGLDKMIYSVSALGEGGFKEITFLHSVDIWNEGEIPRVDHDKVEEAKNRLSPALNNVPDGMKVHIEVLSGNPSDNILATIKKYKVDLVITGSPVSTSLEQIFFGSTTAKIRSKLKVPMMILRPQLMSVYRNDEFALRCRNLNRFWLVPYNDLPRHRYIADKIADYYSQQNENLMLEECLFVSVVDEVSRSEILTKNKIQEAEKTLASLKESFASSSVKVETMVKTGNPLEEIFKVAFDNNISAIVFAENYKEENVFDRILSLAVGSNANYLLNCSWFPLLYFPIHQ